MTRTIADTALQNPVIIVHAVETGIADERKFRLEAMIANTQFELGRGFNTRRTQGQTGAPSRQRVAFRFLTDPKVNPEEVLKLVQLEWRAFGTIEEVQQEARQLLDRAIERARNGSCVAIPENDIVSS